ncbi:MAG: type IV pilus twitching motility protein PilT [Planctomycetota bacterium]|nr:type IV pilus twitching motility protein PilT [Planctomycetota bacterium]
MNDLGGPGEQGRLDIARYFEAAVKRGASDILLTAGVAPCIRLNGTVAPFDLPALNADETRKLLYSVLSSEQVARFEADHELDFSIQYGDRARFRGNAYMQKGAVAAVFRLIPSAIPPLSELGVPAALEDLALQPQGLLLFTGPTGHGKSTTQAALLRIVNERKRCHIITIEDPIEYLHASQRSVIDQREVGEDTRSFAAALKHVLRQDPDVILVGEMRDLETMSTALTAAETGHLVLATLHTNNAIQACDRIIDVFPPYQQNQVRTQLSFCLLAIVAQRLLPRKDGKGRVVAVELLRNVPGIANLIREGKTQQLATIMETGAKFGMQTMDAAIKDLYRKGLVDRDVATRHMQSPQTLV